MSKHNRDRRHKDPLYDALTENADRAWGAYQRCRGTFGDDCVVVLAATDHPVGEAMVKADVKTGRLPAGNAGREAGGWVCKAVPRSWAAWALNGWAGERADEDLRRPRTPGHFTVVVLGDCRHPDNPDDKSTVRYQWAELKAITALDAGESERN
jgi:hypothetical protein